MFAGPGQMIRPVSIGDKTLTLHYKFATHRTLAPIIGPDLTFTRASSGTFFDSSGVLQTASNDVARFDHDPTTNAALGLLMEEGKTNFALHNRDQTNAAWAKSNMTAAQDATGLDDVANSATTLTASAANATSLQTVTIASAVFTNSVYVKRVTGSGDIDISDNNGTNWTTLTGLSTTFWIRHNITRTQANPVFGIRIVTDTDAIEVDFWGLESQDFQTSPIATTTGTVARAADVASVSDVTWYNENEGTFFIIATGSDRSLTGFPAIFQIHDGSNNENILLDMRTTNDYAFRIRSGNVNQAILGTTSNVHTAGTEFMVAGAYATDDFAVSFDGRTVLTDTSGSVPSGLTGLHIGNTTAGARWGGHIAELKYWNVRKSNAFLQSITA